MSQAILGTVLHKNGWLKQNKLRVIALLFVAAMACSVGLPVAAAAQSQGRRQHTNRDHRVTRSEVRDSLQETREILDSSDQVVSSQDKDSVAIARTNGSEVDIPKDAKKGVTFGAESGPKLDIELPNADQSSEGAQVASGVVAYEANNGSANAVQATEDGGVRMLTIIDNPDAPTTYDYKVTVPSGGHIELTLDGGAIVLDNTDQLLAVVATPWAKDADEKEVKTYFTTDGQALTQHVEHNASGVVYPVTADPSFSWSWGGVTINFNRSETYYVVIGGAGAIGGYVGGGLAGGVSAAGGQWVADQALRRGMCLSVWKSHYWWQFVPYMRRC